VLRPSRLETHLEPTRTEFMYFSTPEKLLFYVFVFSSLGYMAWQFADRVRLWRKGRPIDGGDGKWGMPRGDALKGWLRNVVVYVLGQKKVRSSVRRAALRCTWRSSTAS